jgi:hypothetical protein
MVMIAQIVRMMLKDGYDCLPKSVNVKLRAVSCPVPNLVTRTMVVDGVEEVLTMRQVLASLCRRFQKEMMTVKEVVVTILLCYYEFHHHHPKMMKPRN